MSKIKLTKEHKDIVKKIKELDGVSRVYVKKQSHNGLRFGAWSDNGGLFTPSYVEFPYGSQEIEHSLNHLYKSIAVSLNKDKALDKIDDYEEDL